MEDPSEPSDEEAAYAGIADPLRAELLRTHDRDPAVRALAVHEVGRLADVRGMPRLTELLSDHHRVACAAAEGIGAFGVEGRAAAVPLAALLEDGGAMLRQCSLLALAQIGGPQAQETLIGFLQNAPVDYVEQAIDALGRLGAVEAVPHLVGYLEADSISTVDTAARAIERIGPGGAGLVRETLSSERPETRCAAASILAGWESMDDRDELERMSRHDSNRDVRICALGALGRLGDEEAVESLAELVADPESPQRVAAANALGVSATASAVRVLMRSLTSFHQSGTGDTPNAAQAALLAIGARARPALEEALPSGPPLRRALVAETLGLLGDRSAIGSLERAALDTDELVRRAAETALEILRAE